MAERPDDPIAIPVMEETARIEKRVVEIGRTVIHTRVREHDETVEALLQRRDVIVERVPIDRVVSEAPVERRDGDTLVIPVVEERLVVVTQLVLKEELRIRTVVSEEKVTQTVRLRRQHVEIETPDPGQEGRQ